MVHAAFEADPFDEFAGTLAQAALGRPRTGQPQNAFEQIDLALPMQPDQQIVVDGIVRKDAGALERAGQTKAGDLVRLQPPEGGSTIAHRASGRVQKARDDVEGRRLAGPVGADQADDLALADRKIHVRECHEPAEVARRPSRP